MIFLQFIISLNNDKIFILYLLYENEKKPFIIRITYYGSMSIRLWIQKFQEALEAANYSALQEILTENDNFEQNFEIAGNFNSD